MRLRNLWFHTGDRGRMDEDGYLYFAGRNKELIRRRGENISAIQVEDVLSRHPAVAHVAVFAVRSEFLEDEVMAAVVCQRRAQAGLRGAGRVLRAPDGLLHGSALYRVPAGAADYADRQGGKVQAARICGAASFGTLGPREERHRAREVRREGEITRCVGIDDCPMEGNRRDLESGVNAMPEGFPFQTVLRPGDRISFGQACSEPVGLLRELLRKAKACTQRLDG